MGLEGLLEDIEAETVRQEKEILETARAEARSILDAAKSTIENQQTARRARISENAHGAYFERKGALELETRKVKLNDQREALEKVMIEARKLVASMDGITDARLFGILLARAVAGIGKGHVECLDRNRGSVGSGSSGLSLKSNARARMLGGLVATSQNGNLVLDLRYDTLLEEAWERSLASVNEILFEKSD